MTTRSFLTFRSALAARMLVASLAVGSAAVAAPVFTTGGGGGVTTDVFDVAQGVRIIQSSRQYGGFFGAACCGESDARSAFGFTTAAYNGTSGWLEPPNVIFQDGPGAGTTDFIEWQTAGPVNLTSFALRLQQDGTTTASRGAGTFKLSASADGVNFSQVSAGTMPGSPGPNVNVPLLITDSALTGTTANVRAFRLELTRLSTSAPRLIELDGAGTSGAATGTFLDRLAFNATTNTLTGRGAAANDDEGPGLAMNFTASSRVFGTDSIEDAFGNKNGAVEPESFIFGDGGVPDNGNLVLGDAGETVDFIAWRTTEPLSLAGFRIALSGDGAASDRDTELVRFIVGGIEVDLFDNNGFDGTVTRLFAEGAIVGDDFRIEFTRRAGTGPRIFQIDAITGPLTPLNGELVINEVVSSNAESLSDEDGDSPDWIELFNGRDVPVALAGWGLSDNPAQPFKWTFPAVTMPPHTYLVVFASGKDRRVPGAKLHTNFELKATGEDVALTSPDSSYASAAAAAPLREDVSFGRSPNGTGTAWKYFATPTPGRSNNSQTAYDSVVFDPPFFSLAPGFYSAAQSLVLSTPEAGVTLRYSLDSSDPSEIATAYTAPIALASRAGQANVLSMIQGTATANQHTDGWKPPVGEVRKCHVVRARATRPGAIPGPVVTRTYFIGADAVRTDGLPTLSIVTPRAGLFDYNSGIYMLGAIFDAYVAAHPGEALTGHTPANYTQRGAAWERDASLEWFESGGAFGFNEPVELDIQGQSSRSFRQKSFGLKARGTESPMDTFTWAFFPGLVKLGNGAPLTQFRHARLRNMGNDWDYAMLRDSWAHRLGAGVGLNVMSSRPVSIFLDGEYWGVLDLREQQDPRYLVSHYGMKNDDAVILYGPGTLEEGLPGDEQPWLDLLSYCETRDLSVQANYDYVAARVDVEDCLYYFLTEIYLANADWPQNNIRIWRRRLAVNDLAQPVGLDGRWRWFLFDTDLGSGHPWTTGVTENTLAVALAPTGRPGTNAAWGNAVFRRLMTNPAFKNRCINTAADLLNSLFQPARAIALLNTMQTELQPAMTEHIARWQSGGGTVSAWQSRVQVVRDFAAQRAANVRSHFVSQFTLGGTSQITLNVNSSTRGSIRINSLLVNGQLPGANPAAPYPWIGTYFRGIPVPLEAVPNPGYVFAGWSGVASTTANASLTLNGNASVSAIFIPELAKIETITRQPAQVTLTIRGTPGAPYTIQTSPNLIDWTDVNIVTASIADGSATISHSTGDPQRFYRAVSKP